MRWMRVSTIAAAAANLSTVATGTAAAVIPVSRECREHWLLEPLWSRARRLWRHVHVPRRSSLSSGRRGLEWTSLDCCWVPSRMRGRRQRDLLTDQPWRGWQERHVRWMRVSASATPPLSAIATLAASTFAPAPANISTATLSAVTAIVPVPTAATTVAVTAVAADGAATASITTTAITAIATATLSASVAATAITAAAVVATAAIHAAAAAGTAAVAAAAASATVASLSAVATITATGRAGVLGDDLRCSPLSCALCQASLEPRDLRSGRLLGIWQSRLRSAADAGSSHPRSSTTVAIPPSELHCGRGRMRPAADSVGHARRIGHGSAIDALQGD